MGSTIKPYIKVAASLLTCRAYVTQTYHSPHLHLVEIQEMILEKVVRHAFEPHTAYDSLLDTRDDLLIYGRPP